MQFRKFDDEKSTSIQTALPQDIPKFAESKIWWQKQFPASNSHFSYFRAKKQPHDQMCNSANLMTKNNRPPNAPRPKTSPNMQKAKFAHEKPTIEFTNPSPFVEKQKNCRVGFAHQNRQRIAVGWRQTMIKNVDIPKSSAEKPTPPPPSEDRRP
jgi:hypothetical protein